MRIADITQYHIHISYVIEQFMWELPDLEKAIINFVLMVMLLLEVSFSGWLDTELIAFYIQYVINSQMCMIYIIWDLP